MPRKNQLETIYARSRGLSDTAKQLKLIQVNIRLIVDNINMTGSPKILNS